MVCNICKATSGNFYCDGDIAVCEKCHEPKTKGYRMGLQKAIALSNDLIKNINNGSESWPLMVLIRRLNLLDSKEEKASN